MKLRQYQNRTLQELYNFLAYYKDKNPVINLPTGAGKSIIIAKICEDILRRYPDRRVLMLTHQKELIEQNAEKLRAIWPNAPVGIYSASVGQRNVDAITYAGIQTVRNRAQEIGHTDIVLIDECFVSGTKVLTPVGDIEIDKLRCGDVVLNQSGTGIVKSIFSKPVNEIYKLEFDDGSIVECTGDHPFFTESGWREAKTLEDGSSILSPKSMPMLWEALSALDKIQSGWDNEISNVRTIMEKSRMLLSIMLEEIEESNEQFYIKGKDEEETKRNKAQTYKERWERQIASFTSISTSSCSGGRLGGGSCSTNKNKKGGRLSDLLQDRYSKQRKNDRDRIRRFLSLFFREEKSGQEENRSFGISRVVNISVAKQKSARAVYNIRVSGHPSYFANGKLVHNCHQVNHNDEGTYRKLISELVNINPKLRVIGLTASPYRMGHGLITDKPAIFDEILEPTSIEELQRKEFLAKLISKSPAHHLSVEGVQKRGGEYIESQLQKAVDKADQNRRIVAEIMTRAGDRKSWLIFCAGVEHAEHIRDELRQLGISCESVTGKISKSERESILNRFKSGELQAITNNNVLTTGFDAPNIDLIAMLRPTCSPGLYVQMAGRGLRLKEHTDHCLVLDFAGVIEQHGPITQVQTPSKVKKGDGVAPCKICPECDEILPAQVKICPQCEYEFPKQEKKLHLRNDDIMGEDKLKTMDVQFWSWEVATSRKSGKDMVKVNYHSGPFEKITEYLCVWHDGFAGRKAHQRLKELAEKAGVEELDTEDFNKVRGPIKLVYYMDGKYPRIKELIWS